MSKKSKKEKQKSATPASPSTTGKQKAPATFQGMENHFSHYQLFYAYLLTGLSLLFAFLCFDVKISTANDDALILEAGANYARHFFGFYYNFQGTLYPMILGLFTKLFGFNIYFLKSLSALFFTGSLLLLYQTFKNKIPYSVLTPALLITAVNFPFLTYASLTYAECFFMLIYSASFWLIMRVSQKLEQSSRVHWKTIFAALLIALCAQFITLSRSVGVVAIIAFALYFLYKRKALLSLLSVLGFGLLQLTYNGLVQLVWKINTSQFASQSKILLQKDAYDPQKGLETIPGFFTRFIENANIYISSRLMYVLGFRPEFAPVDGLITIVCIALILWSTYLMFKTKQDALLLTTLFSLVLLGATFFALQTSWGQTRLIMIYLPFILFAFFYLLYYYRTRFMLTRYLLPFAIMILAISTISATLKNVKIRFPQLLVNIQDDPDAGYTEDWQNYIRMSRWCKNNLPDSALVAARKAPMSFIFSGGKPFYGIYNVPSGNPDTLLMPLRKAGVDYLLLSELRVDPDQYIENQYISTLHRYAYTIATKYPNAFSLVHQEGNLEKAQLFKINYAYIDSLSKP